MKKFRVGRAVFFLVVGLVVGGGAYGSRSHWLPWLTAWRSAGEGVEEETGHSHGHDDHKEDESFGESVILTDQAIVNLGIRSARLSPGTYWRTVMIPGQIVERPGHSDHRVTSPVDGVVSRILVVPGDTIRPDEELFRIRLTSESIRQAQTDLFQKSREQQMVLAQRRRLAEAGEAIPKERLIEVDSQLARIEVAIAAQKRELAWRGLTGEQIAAVARGEFVNEITVRAPPHWGHRHASAENPIVATSLESAKAPSEVAEVQELSVELGERVQAGQSLCLLAHHHALTIEGRAFADETPLVQRAVQEGWPVAVDFLEPEAAGWSRRPDSLQIRHIANTVDPEHRTISFWIPLENESRRIESNGRATILWRFRPGQRVRIRVPVEKLESVYILPASAVVRDGLENYLFIQNVNRFIRQSIRVIAQDRESVVVANDGSLVPGLAIVQDGAARLNRAIKSAASGAPPGYHVHADGSLHKNSNDE